MSSGQAAAAVPPEGVALAAGAAATAGTERGSDRTAGLRFRAFGTAGAGVAATSAGTLEPGASGPVGVPSSHPATASGASKEGSRARMGRLYTGHFSLAQFVRLSGRPIASRPENSGEGSGRHQSFPDTLK